MLGKVGTGLHELEPGQVLAVDEADGLGEGVVKEAFDGPEGRNFEAEDFAGALKVRAHGISQ